MKLKAYRAIRQINKAVVAGFRGHGSRVENEKCTFRELFSNSCSELRYVLFCVCLELGFIYLIVDLFRYAFLRKFTGDVILHVVELGENKRHGF